MRLRATARRRSPHAGVAVGRDLLLELVDAADEHGLSGLLGGPPRMAAMPWATRCLAGLGLGEPDRGLDRAHDFGGVAADRAAVAVEHLELVGDLVRRAGDVGDVGVFGDDLQGALLAAAADEERRVRLLDVRRVVGRLVEQ